MYLDLTQLTENFPQDALCMLLQRACNVSDWATRLD
jgi:hypothetical protein